MLNLSVFGRTSQEILSDYGVRIINGPHDLSWVIPVTSGGVGYNAVGGLFLVIGRGVDKPGVRKITGWDPDHNLVSTEFGTWYSLDDKSWRFPSGLDQVKPLVYTCSQ